MRIAIDISPEWDLPAMTRPQYVTDSVHQVGGGSLTAPGDCSFFLVNTGGGKSVLIDCGVGEGHGRLLENMAVLGFSPGDLEALILTHCHIDHVGGAARLKRETGCAVAAHRLDSDAIEGRRPELTAADWYGVDYEPVKIDRMLADEDETVELGGARFRCIHTPGHTPGSIAVLFEDRGELVLFGQDIHGPFEPSWGSDMDQWKRSMKRLLALKADVLCEGHFGTFKGKERVREYIEGYLNRY